MSEVVKFMPVQEFPTPAIAQKAEAALAAYKEVRDGLNSPKPQQEERDPVLKACRSGDLGAVMAWIGRGVDIDAYKNAVFMWAIGHGKTETVRFLMQKGVELDFLYNAPIKEAAAHGHAEIVALLIEGGVDIHAGNNEAIRMAAHNGHLEVVRLLIKNGVSIRSLDGGTIRGAVINGHTEVVRLLIENGAMVVPNDYMVVAAQKGHTDIVRLLIESSPDAQASKNSAIVVAAEGGHIAVVTLLIASGADIQIEDNAALRNAAQKGHADIVRLLIENGADVSVLHNRALILAARHHHTETVRVLLEHGADATTQDHDAVWIAAQQGDIEIVRLLIANGADVRSNSNYAIRMAAMNGHTAMIALLIENGADVTALDNSPVRNAARSNQIDALRLLVEHGAEIRAGDNDAVIGASMNGSLDAVRVLIELGADIHAQQEKALRYANNVAVRELLERHGARAVMYYPLREALDQYKLQVPRWRQVLHREPLLQIWREDPALFKGTCYESVRRMLTVEGYGEPTVSTMAFHTAALFQSPERVLQYLKQWGEPGRQQPLHNLVQMIHVPSALPGGVKPNLKDWADGVLKCGPSMARLVKFADKVPSPMKTEDGRTWSMLRTREECARFGFRRAGENFALAALCFEHDLNEGVFDKALAIIQEKQPANKNIPGIDLKGDEFGMPGGRFRRLADGDIKGLFLGEMTDCCQSVGGQGAACAEHGFTSADGGFYVVENAKGKVVGQSWAWRGARGELCLDSLETLGQNVTGAQWFDIIGAFRAALSARNNHNITALTVGTGGATNDSCPGLKKIFTQAAEAKPRDYDGYRDSHKQVAVWLAPC